MLNEVIQGGILCRLRGKPSVFSATEKERYILGHGKKRPI